MLLRIFVFANFIILASVCHAQLADIYANISKSTYELVNGDCPSITAQDLSRSPYCVPASPKYNSNDRGFIAEYLFFDEAAKQETNRLQCSIRKAQAANASAEMKKKIEKDMVLKVQAGIPVYQKLVLSRAALYHQRERVNFLRPSGLQVKPTEEYLGEKAILDVMENETAQLESLLSSLVNSSWNGGTKAVTKAMMSAIKKGYPRGRKIATELNIPKLMSDVSTELSKNKEDLTDQKSKSRGHSGEWDLDNDTKRQMLVRAQQTNFFSKQFPNSPSLSRGLECRLEGKYGKGQDYVDNILFAGSFALSGGAALLSKAPRVLKVALAVGSKAGKITEQGAKIMLFSSFGVTSASMLAQIDKQCLGHHPAGYVRKDTCSGTDKEILGGEIEGLDEGNCILSVAMAALPAMPVFVGVVKGLKKMNFDPRKLMSSWDEKGAGFADRFGAGVSAENRVNTSTIESLDRKMQEFMNKKGAEIEVATPRLVPNREKIYAEGRIQDIEREIKGLSTGIGKVMLEEDINSVKRQIQFEENNLKELKARSNLAQDETVGKNLDILLTESSIEDLKYQLEQLSLGPAARTQALKEELQYVKDRLSALPDQVREAQMATNLSYGIENGTIEVVDGLENYTPSSLYRVTKLPAVKGPRRYDTPVILHPDFQKDLDRLRQLGYEVRFDPTLGVNRAGALHFGSEKVLLIRPDFPYDLFKHELQHAEFNIYIEPKLAQATKLVAEGKSIKSLFTNLEANSFGKDNLDRLEALLKRQNTELAVNETMAVDAQLAQMKLFRVKASEIVETQKYALWHQISGYREILEYEGELNAVQKAEYSKALKKMALMVSYTDGAQAAQKFTGQYATPSTANILAVANRLQKITAEKTKDTPVICDKDGNIFYQKQDGSWERIAFSKAD